LSKTLRILGISVALLALLVFSTVVVTDFDCHSATDDARCPYCHLTHQAPAPIVVAPSVSLLKPVASIPLPQETLLESGPDFSQTSPRAPPAA
jgi:hypothetical protein